MPRLNYDDVRKGKTCDRGTSRRYILITRLCLFYFALENERNGHNVGTAVVPENRFYFSPFLFLFFFLISIPNVN